jgi:dTDP-4-amino-4,6-dideoxygalactose transaminase
VGDDYNLDPSLIEAAITERTKAILPVHLTGRPAEMGPIIEIARKHNLHIVEDCAQAVCADYQGQRVGSLGDIGCFSLHPLKTLNACGDGGVLTTNDSSLYEELKSLRNIGLRTRDDCVAWAPNSRLDTLQAAILLVKLDFVEEWTEKRRANAQTYQRLLPEVTPVQVPTEKSHQRAVYHTFVVLAERRDELKSYLASKGVGTAIHYPVPIHLQQAAAGLGHGLGSFPVTEYQADRLLSLPVYPELQEGQIEYVVETVRDFYNGTAS